MNAYRLVTLQARLKEIEEIKQMCHPTNDSYIVISLNDELKAIEVELKDTPKIDLSNVLIFDQMKRKTPIKHKLNDKLADVIDLNEYRNKRMKKVS